MDLPTYRIFKNLSENLNSEKKFFFKKKDVNAIFHRERLLNPDGLLYLVLFHFFKQITRLKPVCHFGATFHTVNEAPVKRERGKRLLSLSSAQRPLQQLCDAGDDEFVGAQRVS